MRNIFKGLTAGLLLISMHLASVPYTNLFQPYDFLLFYPLAPGRCFDFNVAYEGAFNTQGYATDPEDRVDGAFEANSNVFRRKVNVLQIWNEFENFSGSLSGSPKGFGADLESYLFNLKSERLKPLVVTGDFRVPVNLMFSARFAITDNVLFGIYVPYLEMELNNIEWLQEVSSEATGFEAKINQLLSKLEQLGNIDLQSDWKEKGVGDIASIIWWYKHYPQAKQWLKDVFVSVRGGLTYPTGKSTRNNVIFGLPLGYDGGLGLIFGGTLGLQYGSCFSLGVDGEFLNLFGSRRERRIKTDELQADLTFLQMVDTQFNPGFLQHYTLFMTFEDLLVEGFSTTLAYQHTRQHEGELFLDSSLFDSRVANNAESLQDWTTHSIIWSMRYVNQSNNWWCPSIQAWVKHGFNGKRAVLFDTAGVQIGITY